MATSLDKLENKVQIHHRNIKCFHTVKRLRKSVQYIQRYSTKYAEPRREQATQCRLGCFLPKLLDQSSPKFYTILVALFNHAYTRRYPIPFPNATATKVQSLPFSCTKLVAMAMYFEISEKEVQIDHQHPKCFHLVKRLRKSVQWILR